MRLHSYLKSYWQVVLGSSKMQLWVTPWGWGLLLPVSRSFSQSDYSDFTDEFILICSHAEYKSSRKHSFQVCSSSCKVLLNVQRTQGLTSVQGKQLTCKMELSHRYEGGECWWNTQAAKDGHTMAHRVHCFFPIWAELQKMEITWWKRNAGGKFEKLNFCLFNFCISIYFIEVKEKIFFSVLILINESHSEGLL